MRRDSHHRHQPRTAREHRLAERARRVAQAYSDATEPIAGSDLDLLRYAERVVALENAWDRLLETLAA